MKLYDISMTISEEMTVYKNRDEKRPKISTEREYYRDGINESSICMNLHTGTHIDAPLHALENGETVDSIALDSLVRDCSVLDFTDLDDKISSGDLSRFDIEEGSFLLFKTANSFSDSFVPDFIYLDSDAASYLVEKNISGVGIDALGIERNQPGHDTHRILLENGVVILEGLRLRDVPPGKYQLVALPLKMSGVDGSPARVILLGRD